MEMVLYKRKSRHCFTGVYAEVSCRKLTITRHEMDDDDDDYGIGESEFYIFFNEWHTAKLMKALQVETPRDLLLALKRKFRSDGISRPDNMICEFCDENEIKYRTQIYY